MNNASLALDWPSGVLLLPKGDRKTARPASSPNRLFKSTWQGPKLVRLQRRVPVVAWHSDWWTKKILTGRVQPDRAEKVRILRLKAVNS